MYDARGSSGSGSGNLVFGLIAIAVVGLAFLLAWFGGGFLNGKSSNPISQAAAPQTGALASLMSTPEEQRFLAALNSLDSGIYAQLDGDYTAAGNGGDQLRTVGEAAGRAIMENVEHLPNISADDINGMLTEALRQVSAARQSNHQLCRGATYVGVEDMSPADVERWLARNGLSLDAVYASTVVWQANLLEMIQRAKRSPKRHGKINSQDEQAFQGLMMAMMSDPVIMQLAMANGDTAALSNVNVCAVAESVLRQVNGLPDGTKARAWAAVFDMPEFREGMRQARQMGF